MNITKLRLNLIWKILTYKPRPPELMFELVSKGLQTLTTKELKQLLNELEEGIEKNGETKRILQG